MGWGCRPLRIAGDGYMLLEALEVAILAAYRYQVSFYLSIINPMGCKKRTKAEGVAGP